MKIAIYAGTFESEPTRVTVHETQGILFATLEVASKQVPPTMQTPAQARLLKACKERARSKARAAQPAVTESLPEPHSEPGSETRDDEPTSQVRTSSAQPEQPAAGSAADQPTAGALRVTGTGEAADRARAQPGTSAGEVNSPTSRTNQSVLLPARTTRIRVPAQQPGRIIKEYVDA